MLGYCIPVYMLLHFDSQRVSHHILASGGVGGGGGGYTNY